MRTVVITGVSSGIGKAAARALIDRGFFVFGSVRREEDAAELVSSYPNQFKPLLFDVTDEDGIAAAVETVSRAIGDQRIAALVNNAGISISGPLIHQPMADVRKQFDVNLFAPMRLVQAFAGMLGASPKYQGPKGRVVNITSVTGKLGFPFVGAYCASKHAFEGYSDSLRRELMLHGIDVVVIGPGGVDTPITYKAEAEMGPYDNTDYGKVMRAAEMRIIEDIRAGLTPDVVGRAIADAVTTPKPKARYAIVKHKMRDWVIPRILPKRILDRGVSRRFNLVPKA
ncbi:hypothetical protein ASE00_09625 [Sphingomonas sp. Root710]|uniref:SDR family oxidoreductase n=1 Tax=Sphingomonas sp. Root710 TaxID=1736594 RepID=UPI0006F76AAC|nr:SDR family oxidoreductase [Sphingomonas sp. Root710]KRB82327.1 hypothetical protein ASE00_09625 [Sphingomonas sp. Root710]